MNYYVNMWYTNNIREIEKNKYIIMLGLEKEEIEDFSKRSDEVVKRYMEEVIEVNEDPEFQEYMSKEEDERKIRNSYKEEGYEKGNGIGHCNSFFFMIKYK